jgi:hypothetical protein|tara:strand:- start:350 stop:625 length:276 start_codon:yes stop_codon:yes gene_type:complete
MKTKKDELIFNKDLSSIHWSELSDLKDMTTMQMVQFAFDESIWGSDFEISKEQAVKIKSLFITNYFRLESKRNEDIGKDFAKQEIKAQRII